MIKVNTCANHTARAGEVYYCSACNSYACDCHIHQNKDDFQQHTYSSWNEVREDTEAPGAINQYRRKCAKTALEYGEESQPF